MKIFPMLQYKISNIAIEISPLFARGKMRLWYWGRILLPNQTGRLFNSPNFSTLLSVPTLLWTISWFTIFFSFFKLPTNKKRGPFPPLPSQKIALLSETKVFLWVWVRWSISDLIWFFIYLFIWITQKVLLCCSSRLVVYFGIGNVSS